MKPKICKFMIKDKVKIMPIEREGIIIEASIRGDNFIFYKVRYIDKADVQIKEFLEEELRIIKK